MNRVRRNSTLLLVVATSLLAVSPILALTQTAAPVLPAKFEGNLTTKSAKLGDVVTAKTMKTVKLKDGTEIPKGSKLVGKVLAAQSKQDGKGTSFLAIKFDRMEVKGGATLPITGLIASIGQVRDPASLGFNSVLGRGGVGSTPGLDPSIGADAPINRDDTYLPPGSSLSGIGIGMHLDKAGANAMKGVDKDIMLDSTVMIRVELE
jgi:hypothetical protein